MGQDKKRKDDFHPAFRGDVYIRSATRSKTGRDDFYPAFKEKNWLDSFRSENQNKKITNFARCFYELLK